MKIRPVVELQEMKTLPSGPDANAGYAATGFVKKRSKNVPLILPIGDAALARLHIDDW